MNIRKTTLLFSLSLALFVGGLSFAGSNHASAAYDGGRIIDNEVFLNANSMNVAQIQSFLASKGSGLASRSFVLQCYGANSQERQLYTSVGAACDQNMSAAHIIFYASRIYGINPQVILATLQKEQSLITTGNPTSWQLNQAMGYGCPTTGNCSGNSTFSYQIDSGAWVMRFHYERANGNFQWWTPSSSWVCGTEKNFYKPNLYPRQNVRFYDEDNVLYRTHYIENAATSSFYCYTPHAYNNPQGLFGRPAFGSVGRYYSGSYNFVIKFEEWFGSTINSCGPNETRWPHAVSYYNPRTYGHFYTVYACEAHVLQANLGYRFDGPEYNITDPALPGAQIVWRLYNSRTEKHLWTTSQADINNATSNAGYRVEGIAYYVAPPNAPGVQIVWRLYNPKTYQHVWTKSQNSINLLTNQLGFRVEGIAFYSQ